MDELTCTSGTSDVCAGDRASVDRRPRVLVTGTGEPIRPRRTYVRTYGAGAPCVIAERDTHREGRITRGCFPWPRKMYVITSGGVHGDPGNVLLRDYAGQKSGVSTGFSVGRKAAGARRTVS